MSFTTVDSNTNWFPLKLFPNLFLQLSREGDPELVGLGRVRSLQISSSRLSKQRHAQGLPAEKDLQEVCGRETPDQLYFQERNFAKSKLTSFILLNLF